MEINEPLVVFGEDQFYNLPEPTFFETLKSTYSYNWMPAVRRREEFVRFGDVPRDPSFDYLSRSESKSGDYANNLDSLVRAKNDEHYDFIIESINQIRRNRDIMSRGSGVAVFTGHIADPTLGLMMIPGFNLGLGASIGSSALRMGTSGFMYGAALEARRAPFADDIQPYEIETNLLGSTILGAGFGTAFKGAPYLLPFSRSTAGKVARIAKREKVDKTFKDDGTVNLDDPKKAGQVVSDDYYDAAVTDYIPSPAKTVLNDKAMPKFVKEIMAKLSYNASIPLKGQAAGATPQSVAQMKVTHHGTAFQYENVMRTLHANEIGRAKPKQFMGVYAPSNFDDWYEETMRRYINMNSADPAVATRAREGLSDFQKQAHTFHKQIMDEYDMDARFVGLLQDDNALRGRIGTVNAALTKKEKILADLSDVRKERRSLSPKQAALETQVKAEVAALKKQISELEEVLKTPTRKSFLYPIYYDKIKIKSDLTQRERLTEAFERRYNSDRLAMGDDAGERFTSSAREDAERTVARIVEEDFAELEESMSSMPASKHLAHRKTNVDEWEVVDQMVVNMDAMYTYFDRMGSRIEFARAFQGKTVADILEEIEIGMRAAKPKRVSDAAWEKKIATAKQSFQADFDSVMGAVQRNPDRLDNKIAFYAKNYAGWVYLPMAGISAITDIGSVVMAHGMKNTLRASVAAIADTGYTSGVAARARAAGETLDLARAMVARRIMGDQIKRMQPTMGERFVQGTNQLFYTANALGPITVATKTLDQILVNDEFIRLSAKRVDGNLTPQEAAKLNKYGIDDELAAYINDMPTSKHESFDFVYGNTDEWPVSTAREREFRRRFQAATSAHANNTVIYGQQFDTPLISRGVVYMKDNAFFRANRDAFPIDEKASTQNLKYVRVESGLLSLPFVFMNFAFAANNKILGAIRDPNRLYRIQGTVALLGLSYMSLDIKKPDWWFENKEAPELMMRVVDHSGVLGLYSDLAYMGLAMAAGSGVFNPEDSMIKPKYTPDGIDAVMEPFGAPLGLGVEYGRGILDFLNGDFNEGSKRFFYNAPIIGLPYIKEDMKDLALGERGAGRF